MSRRAEMRTHPIGTGPFKFVEFKPNESIKLTRNPDYWKPGRPYLDGIECTIIPNRSTAILAFVAGKFDMTFPSEVTIPLLKDVKTPGAERGLRGDADQRRDQPDGQPRHAAVRQSGHPPGDGADARPQGLHRHPRRGPGRYRRRHAAAAGRALGHAAGDAGELPGYGPDIDDEPRGGAQADAEAGYGPDKRLAVKVSTRNIASIAIPRSS